MQVGGDGWRLHGGETRRTGATASFSSGKSPPPTARLIASSMTSTT